MPSLVYLHCKGTAVRELDLAAVPNLEVLICSNTNIASLDLSAVPKRTCLLCRNTQIAELDIRPLTRLDRLSYDIDRTQLRKRSDQQFHLE